MVLVCYVENKSREKDLYQGAKPSDLGNIADEWHTMFYPTSGRNINVRVT